MKHIFTLLLLSLIASYSYSQEVNKSGIQVDDATVALSYKGYSTISITGHTNSTHRVRIVCDAVINGDPISTDETVDLKDPVYNQGKGGFLYKVLTDKDAIVQHALFTLYEYPYTKKAIAISIL